MAIPIAPAGIGVGHAVFDTLFGLFGINNGASLFNIYLLAIVAESLTGAIPYLLTGGLVKNTKEKMEFD